MANYDFTYTGAEIQAILDTAKKLKDSGYIFLGVATPSTNPGTPTQKVYYEAKQAGTYTNFGGVVLPDGISLLIWNGSWTSETVMCGDGGVFDISVYKSSGGTLATFADLAAALDGGNNIPASARKGGMSVKFVQSSDNKYIQARLMGNSFTTDVSQWQSIEDEPTAGSQDLVKSGGVATNIANLYKATTVLPRSIFEKGDISTSTGEDSTYRPKSRARTPIITFPFDVTIQSKTTGNIIVFYFEEGAYSSNTGWISEKVIKAGQQVRILATTDKNASAQTEYSLTAICNEFNFTVSYPTNEQINDILIKQELIKENIVDIQTDFNAGLYDKTEWHTRRRATSPLSVYQLPDSFDLTKYPIHILTDGYRYRYAFNISSFKRVGGNTIYCTPNGTGTGTRTSPTNLQNAIANLVNNNDSVILSDGVHMLGFGTELTKSINIVAENTGKAYIAGGENTFPNFTQYSNHIYSANKGRIAKIFQIVNGEVIKLERAESIESMVTGTWYAPDNSIMYVWAFYDTIPNNQNIILVSDIESRPTINIANSQQDTSVYLEGLKVIGGCPNALYVSNSSIYTNASIAAKDCDFIGSFDVNNGKVVSINGANAYFQNCKAMLGSYDGFGYTEANGVGCNFIEIGCIGAWNGLDGTTSDSQNGSTAHENCKGIRIDGLYFHNKGANVADVQAGCITVNINSSAYDSQAATGTIFSADFCAQQSGAIMYLLSCWAFGQSFKNVAANDGTTIYTKDCDLPVSLEVGTGQIIEIL